MSDEAPSRQKRLRSLATLMTETGHLQQESDARASNEVSHGFDSFLESLKNSMARLRGYHGDVADVFKARDQDGR